MALTIHELASGDGWQVSDVVCDSGPGDRPFEELHDAMTIAAVTAGTFQYRGRRGTALLAPGAVLLGNAGTSFECGHEHGHGDRCLAFRFTPECLEAVVAALPGGCRADFSRPSLPPLSDLLPLLTAAEIARNEADAPALEELALRLAAAVAGQLCVRTRSAPPASRREEARITAAVRRIEAGLDQPQPLSELARAAAMSPYHFLRTFRRVVGITPHQFVLRLRLQRAAVRLRRTRHPVSAIAFDAGFGDLSTFNRRFRKVMGMPPSVYRLKSPAA